MPKEPEHLQALFSTCSPKERGEVLAGLFMQHRERLKRMVNVRLDRRLKSRLDPSDVLQEVYLEASSGLSCTSF
jgi:DNA-directed RNA polymerase specialized sigma24 family protein